MLARAKAQGMQAAPRKQAQTAGNVLDGMAAAWEGFEDPVMREIAKTQFEVVISKAMGLPGKINLPDSADLEANRLVQLRESLRLQREIDEETYMIAKASLLDVPKDDMDLKALGLTGVDMDTLAESNPDAFIALANKKGFPINRRIMALGGAKDTDTASAGPAFQQEQAKKQVDVLQTQASGLKAAEDVVKGGESQTAAAKAALKTSFEALGADTDFFDSDFDTERGGVALADATDTLLRSAGPAFERMAAEGMLAAVKDDVVDFLEDADSANGQLIVNDRPTFYTAVSLMRMAKARGVTDGDQFKEMGLGNLVGIEGRSFNDFLAKEAKTSGADPIAFAATLGL